MKFITRNGEVSAHYSHPLYLAYVSVAPSVATTIVVRCIFEKIHRSLNGRFIINQRVASSGRS